MTQRGGPAGPLSRQQTPHGGRRARQLLGRPAARHCALRLPGDGGGHERNARLRGAQALGPRAAAACRRALARRLRRAARHAARRTPRAATGHVALPLQLL